MNGSIKRRQTLLINWLTKTLNCQPITRAESGSYYTEFNTQYTGKSVIRISDHLSGEKNYIHIIFSSLNTTVVINYRNFIWTGTFTNAKQIIHTLIMSKAMIEQCNPTSKENLIPKENIINNNIYYEASFTGEKKQPDINGLISLSKSDFKRMTSEQRTKAIRYINIRFNRGFSTWKGINEKYRKISIAEFKLLEK